MITYNMQKSEICWHGLLNRSEARVLSPVEERKLLVELVDCKNRILECLAQTDDAIWHESVPQTDFQQLVRDLAGPDNSRLDPPTEGLRSLCVNIKRSGPNWPWRTYGWWRTSPSDTTTEGFHPAT